MIRRCWKVFSSLLIAGSLLMGVAPAWSQDTAGAVVPYEFDTPAQQQRYLALSKILRCPMCQNQNLNDSGAGIAGDLRRELHRLISEGKSDAEIIEFMKSRYGPFIIYDPPLDKSTWLLWFGPVVMLLIAVLIVFALLRRQSARAEADTGDDARLEQARARLADKETRD